MSARVAGLEATVGERAADHARTAERVAILERECTAARREAEEARQVAAALREAHAGSTDELRRLRDHVAEVGARMVTAEAERAARPRAGHEHQTVEQGHGEPEAAWREERARLETACRQAQDRSAELEAELARRRQEMAARESREATLQDELAAARARLHEALGRMPADGELERLRTSLTETDAALHDARGEVAILTQTTDELTADRVRLAAELAASRAELAASADATRREIQAAETARVEREARWREERAELEATCRHAQARGVELEAALARRQDELAEAMRREAAVRAERDAAGEPEHEDPSALRADEELGRARASLAEAETALDTTRTELACAKDELASLSKAHDEATADRSRLTAELAVAEERSADLERRLEELTNGPVPAERPVPF